MKHSVILIFGEFSGNLSEIASDAHVWLEEAGCNRDKAQCIWNADLPYSQTSGVTIFNNVGSDKNRGLYDYLSVIDEHHPGSPPEEPPWQKITVLGIDVATVDSQKISEIINNVTYTITIENGRLNITRGANQSLYGSTAPRGMSQ